MLAARNRSVLSQGSRSYKSAKVAAKRLEEAALSCKGDERVQLLRRWLVTLKETQRATTVVRELQLGDNPDQTAPLLIETEKLLAQLFETEMNRRLKEDTYKGKKFNAICHFLGYQARGALPSKFDCDYAYASPSPAHLIKN
ncbi:Pyrophosphate--fructose 6-phosphate 1-phosphotransferase subunit alpha 2 [Zea mays]|uniref:Pyrophosphate--fructose 6-phosphate 1-phosphotransferase subunit alpha 2 n=1 Tax=Zea mays TaxID=4577 RepID=A0A1D6EAA9_MAIZE|nr:Pyrophosphate--fructose 6-phosphate 1-phosphotransferase subunit alpha 2 [Zea mays]